MLAWHAQDKHDVKLNMEARACNPKTLEVEVGGGMRRLELSSAAQESEAILEYTQFCFQK